MTAYEVSHAKDSINRYFDLRYQDRLMSTLWRKQTEDYQGLKIRCAPGVHAAALDALSAHLTTQSRIVDLASGSGAFVARLMDAGFRNVTSVERDTYNYQLTRVPCISLDLDRPFAHLLDGPVDAVSAIEIIEHLCSPVAFLTEVRALLRVGGMAVISTPNVGELNSRIKFLLRGQLRYFDEPQYRFQRHISPVLPNLAPMLLQEAGLELLSIGTAGSFDGPLRRATLGLLARGVARLNPGQGLTGECLVILARAVDVKVKPAP